MTCQHDGVNEENCVATLHMQCLGGVHFNPLKMKIVSTTAVKNFETFNSSGHYKKNEALLDCSADASPNVNVLQTEREKQKCEECADSDMPRLLIAVAGSTYC